MTDIKTLNDNFRRTFSGGRVMLTCGIRAKSQSELTEILNQVKCFNNFTTCNDLNLLQQKMASDSQAIQRFLKEQGFADSEISVERLNTDDLKTNPYRSSEITDSRYILDQTITVRTNQVDKVETALSQTSSLVSKGIILDNQEYSSPVSYLFTGLNEIKPKMLEQATKNAKEAAEEFAKSSDSTVGKIKTANQGVFSVLPREQIPGISENMQINKTVRVVSTVVYYLD